MKGSNMLNLNKKIIWVVVLCWGSLILAGNAFAAESTDAITLAEVEANYGRVLSAEGAVETSAFLKQKKKSAAAASALQETKFGVLSEGRSIDDGAMGYQRGDEDGIMGDDFNDPAPADEPLGGDGEGGGDEVDPADMGEEGEIGGEIGDIIPGVPLGWEGDDK